MTCSKLAKATLTLCCVYIWDFDEIENVSIIANLPIFSGAEMCMETGNILGRDFHRSVFRWTNSSYSAVDALYEKFMDLSVGFNVHSQFQNSLKFTRNSDGLFEDNRWKITPHSSRWMESLTLRKYEMEI